MLGNIQAEMGRRGLRSPAVAELIGMPDYTVRHRLRGQSEFKLSELVRIAAALDVPLTRLVE